MNFESQIMSAVVRSYLNSRNKLTSILWFPFYLPLKNIVCISLQSFKIKTNHEFASRVQAVQGSGPIQCKVSYQFLNQGIE